MEDIDFANLLSNLMEIEYDSDDDDYFQIEEEEEEECLELEDDVSEEDILDLKAIVSANFDPVVFDR
ncbi:hypothetical protein M9Y10_023517 [Tritrichomonas musculus]|uniref:Uncharacterized protein n=1 Tax=Tritrichomonas musculus TaxID=1915356 RepID=A0ABR2KVC1_9EUKA